MKKQVLRLALRMIIENDENAHTLTLECGHLKKVHPHEPIKLIGTSVECEECRQAYLQVLSYKRILA